MPSIIKIKRSTTAGAPSTLNAGELAYSFADPTNVQGGSRLFIGDGSNITVIGGKFFTDMLDHVPGTLTAGSALITDSFNKIDVLNVDNITLNNNTISTTNSNGDLTLSPNGTGTIDFYGAYAFPRTDGTAGQVLTTDGAGGITWQPTSSTLTVGDDALATTNVDLLTETLSVLGGEGIDTAVTDNTITISAEDASDTNKGIASFDATNFTITTGNVVANDITLSGDSGSASATLGESFTVTGGDGITTSASGTTVTITGVDATDTVKGIASFDVTDFTVTTGNVTLNSERIEDISGAMVSGTGATQTNISVGYDDDSGKFTFEVPEATLNSLGVASFDTANFTVSSGAVSAKNITLGSSTLTLGSTTTAIAGLTQLDVDNLRLDGATISAQDAVSTDVNIRLLPKGTGTVTAAGIDLLKVDTNLFYVSNTAGNDADDGRRVNSAFLTVKHALQQATSGDTIIILPGEYEEVFPLTVPVGVTVRGSGLRATSIKPTSATNTEDGFLLNGESTVEDLTVKGMFYDPINETGYAFRFAQGAVVAERSPYIQRVTVLNKGSGAGVGDPYGFDTADAGRGVLLDGDAVSRTSIEAAMLFNECTFFVPNSRALVMTNGARTEWLNCFSYFADLAIEGKVGSSGWGGSGKTLVTFAGVTGAGFEVGETVRITSTDSSTVIDLVAEEVDGSKITVAGRIDTLEDTDFTPFSIVGLSSNTTATSIVRYDRSQFAAEMRSISSATVYGNQGVKADGDDVVIQLMAHNFAYIGTGADLSNDKSAVIQENEVIEVNGGRVYYNSVDQVGNFRVGDLFSVNFETGAVSFQAPSFDVTSLSGITFTDGTDNTVVNPSGISTGNLIFGGNTISTSQGGIILDPSGSNEITLNSPTTVSGVLTVGDYSFPVADGTSGQALVTDGNGNLTFSNVSTILNIAADTGSTDGVSLISDTLNFLGGEGIDTAVTDNTITISAEDASDTNKGIASFDATHFTVTTGNVVANDITLSGDSGSASATLGESFTIAGGDGITTSGTGTTLTVSGVDATDTVKGIASFDVTDFTVTSGAVVLNAERVEDIAGDMVSGTGATQTNISVGYDDDNGKFTFEVPAATDSVLGVASFNSADFDVTSGAVDLKDTVIQSISTDSVGTEVVPTNHAISILGGEGIDVTHSGSVITIDGEDASDLNKGIASFSSSYFTVTGGDVAIDDATDISKGIASFDTNNFTVTSGAVSAKSATLGTSTITLGSTTNSLAGLQQLEVDNIRIDGNEISSNNIDGDISLNPNGNGTVDVNSTRITSLAEPIDPQDAATKAYVDASRSGLDVKESVRVATTANITLSNTQTIDGVALSVGDRVLVKDQTDPIENGLYVVSSGAWTRSADADEPNEVSAGLFVFVEEGTANADSGFVLTTDNPLVVGTDGLTFVQFSGAGQIVAGDGLTKVGNTLSVNVANGLVISADNVELAATVAGAGLTYSSGIIAVGGTANRIVVDADSVDISSSYVGQSSITTLGTISTGVWNGDVIGSAYGGTGKSSYNAFDLLVGNSSSGLATLALGSASKFLQVNETGDALVYGDIDGGTYA